MTRRTPDNLLGRASSGYSMLSAAATLTGMLAGAGLGQWLGNPAAVNLATLTVLASAALALRVPAPARRPGLPAAHP